jgi:hypothetical protein
MAARFAGVENVVGMSLRNELRGPGRTSATGTSELIQSTLMRFLFFFLMDSIV